MNFIFFAIAFLFLIFLGGFFQAPFAPTKRKDFERIAKLANLKKGQIFYDLGSGTGEMLFYLSNKYKINCVGIEISPILYLYSKIKSLFYKNVKIFYGNFFNYDLSKADVIHIFLMPKSYKKIKEKIFKGIKENAKVIVYSWPIGNYKPVKISRMKNRINYYLYDKSSISS